MIETDPLLAAIKSLRPNASWSMNGTNYAALVWSDAVQTKPTEAEVNAEITRLANVAASEASRAAAIKADAGRADLINRLKTATPAQIDNWVDANVTTIASVRTVFKAILKAIALDQR